MTYLNWDSFTPWGTLKKLFSRAYTVCYLKTFKPEYVILVLNWVPISITSKIQLRDHTDTTLFIMLHVPNLVAKNITLVKQVED